MKKISIFFLISIFLFTGCDDKVILASIEIMQHSIQDIQEIKNPQERKKAISELREKFDDLTEVIAKYREESGINEEIEENYLILKEAVDKL